MSAEIEIEEKKYPVSTNDILLNGALVSEIDSEIS